MQHLCGKAVPLSLVLGALLAVTAPLHARQELRSLTDYEAGHSWFSRDKAYHFSVAAASAAAVYIVAREFGVERRPAALSAIVLVGTAGLVWELVDRGDPENLLTRQRFSRRDLVWNGVGIAVGIAVPDRLLRDRWSMTRAARPFARAVRKPAAP